MTGQLELRPVSEADLPSLEEFALDRETKGEFQWFGWSDLRRWRQGWEENGLIGADGGTLMVVLGGERLGAVVWHRQPAGPAGHSWEIGIAMFPPSRGRGYGTQAHRLITSYLFAHTAVHRIQAVTFRCLLRLPRQPGRPGRGTPSPGSPGLAAPVLPPGPSGPAGG
jgi:RimJ/RimL family protein N-acetyltransferase